MPDNKGDSRQEIRLAGTDGSVTRHEVVAYINDCFINVGKVPYNINTEREGEQDVDLDTDEHFEFKKLNELEVF